MTSRTLLAAQAALDGRRPGLSGLLPFLGPAFIAAVAYVDPGNFATNIQGGAQFGYRLLWVVLLANLMAMLFQGLSAKLGIATGKNLAELCRDTAPRGVVYAMWCFSEIGAMATDLAEFLGAAIAFHLLFGMPMMAGAFVTGLVTYALLLLDRHGFRAMELLIGGFVAIIAGAYVLETILVRPDWGAIAQHTLVPWLGSSASVTLAVAIVGATVMPHVLYLHSALTQQRVVTGDATKRRRLERYTRNDVVIALSIAGLVNLAMMFMAAAVFHESGHADVASIETAYQTLIPLFGGAAAAVFLISLLASGISSSVVGTMAGQVIMQGFVGFAVPLWVRRVVTMLPAIAVIAWGADVTQTLIVSQAVLSMVLPIPIAALLWFTSRRASMGPLVNGLATNVLAVAAGVTIVGLNGLLLWMTFFPG